jgi:hypothetical protein
MKALRSALTRSFQRLQIEPFSRNVAKASRLAHPASRGATHIADVEARAMSGAPAN